MLRDDPLKQAVLRQLRDFAVHLVADVSAHSHAAVAIAIVDAGLGPQVGGLPEYAEWSNQAALLLTRRSAKLRNHPGQWAFPGGRLDAGESVIDCALREMSEEVGVHVGADQVLGRLDDFVTRSGFVISPIVVWAGPVEEMDLNEHEVASVHRIPLTEFLRRDAPKLDVVHHSDHPVLRMPVGDDSIAAPTAAMIYQFREVCLLGRSTRVAHFEQPEFAWR